MIVQYLQPLHTYTLDLLWPHSFVYSFIMIVNGLSVSGGHILCEKKYIYRKPLLLPPLLLQVRSCVALKWRSSAKLIMLKASVAKSAARWRRVSWRLEAEQGDATLCCLSVAEEHVGPICPAVDSGMSRC